MGLFIGMLYEEHDQIDINCLKNIMGYTIYNYDEEIKKIILEHKDLLESNSDSMLKIEKDGSLLIVHSLGNTQWYLQMKQDEYTFTEIIEFIKEELKK